MNIYKCLYNIIRLQEDFNVHVKELLKLSIASGLYMKELGQCCPYSIGDSTSDYSEKLMNYFINDHQAGTSITEIIYGYVAEGKDNSEIHGRWLRNLVEGDSQDIIGRGVCVASKEYERLLMETRDFEKYKAKFKSLNETEKASKDKMRILEKEKSGLAQENKKLENRIKELENEKILYEGRIKLFGKRVLLLCNSNQDYTDIEKKYSLQWLRMESSIKPSPNMEDLMESCDIVILSTGDASHSVFNKISKSGKVFLTERKNLNAIFEELVLRLGGNKDDKCK